MTMEDLWSVRDVARFLGVPVPTIYAWRHRRVGPPAFRLGKHLRFRPSDVAEWLERQREAVDDSCQVPAYAERGRDATVRRRR